jgi:hypothetical protein
VPFGGQFSYAYVRHMNYFPYREVAPLGRWLGFAVR